MRRHGLVMLAVVMFFTAGCSLGKTSAGSNASVIAEVIEEETEESEGGESTEISEAEEEGKEDLTVKEAEESLKALEESLMAREESLKEAEESLSGAESSLAEILGDQEITYRQMVTSPDQCMYKNVIYSGEILRSATVNSASVQIVLAVDGNKGTQLVGEYRKDIVADTLRVGDWIRISGQFAGMVRYQMNSGSIETFPTVNIKAIDQVIKAVQETQPMTRPEVQEETRTQAETTVEEMTEAVPTPTEPESRTSPVISAGQR